MGRRTTPPNLACAGSVWWWWPSCWWERRGVVKEPESTSRQDGSDVPYRELFRSFTAKSLKNSRRLRARSARDNALAREEEGGETSGEEVAEGFSPPLPTTAEGGREPVALKPINSHWSL